MFTKILNNQYGQMFKWGMVAVVLNLLLLLPLFQVDYSGIAFAQTGPPDDGGTPTPTATVTSTPTSSSTPVSTFTSVPVSQPLPGNTPNIPVVKNPVAAEEVTRNTRTADSADNHPTVTFTPLPRVNTVVSGTPSAVPNAGTPSAVPNAGTPGAGPNAGTPGAGPNAGTPGAGAPETIPNSGTPSKETSRPADLPTGVPTLTGFGSIHRIAPSEDGKMAEVKTKLGEGGYECSVKIGSSSEEKHVKIDEGTAAKITPPAPIPAAVEQLSTFHLDVFVTKNNGTATKETFHSPALIFMTPPLTVPNGRIPVLMRYDEDAKEYQLPEQTYDRLTRILEAKLPKTSFFVLAIQPDQASGLAPVWTVTESAMQVATPTTTPLPIATVPPQAIGGPSSSMPFGWLLFFMLMGLIGAVVAYMLLGKKGRTSSKMTTHAVEHTSEADGLVFAFGTSPHGQTALHVNLASLADTFTPKTTALHESAVAQLNLPSIEVEAGINAVKTEILKSRHAIMLSNGHKLTGWNTLATVSNSPVNAEVVYVGHLDWPQRSDIFTYLNKLRSGDRIETEDKASHAAYVVSKVQLYHSDKTPAIEIPQTEPKPQLVLVAWSDAYAYELDKQEYRDYLVVQATSR